MALDYTLTLVLLGSSLLGIVAGMLGCFALLRKQSLLGDAISHAALPGVALAFMLTLSKNPLVLVLGAVIAGWLGTLLVLVITRNTKLKEDAALGIVLSVFFGLGIVLLTLIQNHPSANKAGLDTFLFGNASTLLKNDIVVMAVLGGIVLLLLALFWKEFKLLTFDRDFSASVGYPTKSLDVLLMTLIVVAIVIGLQTVGVVLMSAMLVAPAAAARQWTNRLGIMVFLAAFFGALAGVAGGITSSLVSKLPTGPTIVVYVSGIVVVSLFFAPARGLVWEWWRRYEHRQEIRRYAVLEALFLLAQSHSNPLHAHDVSSLQAVSKGDVLATLGELSGLGLVKKSRHKWALTKNGVEAISKGGFL